MADPVYDDHRIDLVTVTFAVVLALVPQVVDLMMMPPALSGTHQGGFELAVCLQPELLGHNLHYSRT